MRLLLVLLLILACTLAHGMALVQSALGGNASGGSGSVPGYSETTTSTSVNTSNGNLVIVGVWSDWSTAQVMSYSPGLSITIPAGVTWTHTASAWLVGNPGNGGRFDIFFMYGAPAISTNIAATISFSGSGGHAVSNVNIEFSVYEFSGIKTTSAVDTSASNNDNSGSGTTVDAGTLTTTATDLLFTCFQALPGSNILAGSGYTLGPSAVAATIGQCQYQLNVPAGSVATAFNGTETYWGTLAFAFKPAVIPPSSIPRHRGSIF